MAYLHSGQNLKKMRELAFTNAVITGNFVHECSLRTLNEKILVDPTVMEALSSVTTTSERIQALCTHFPVADLEVIMEMISEKLTKSLGVTKDLLNKARLFVNAREHEMALRVYNLALCFAPPGSPSIRTIHIETYRLMTEIRPNDFPVKNLDDSDLTSLVANFGSALPNLGNHKYGYHNKETQQFCDDRIFKIWGKQNERMPSAGQYIKLVSDKNKGRHLIVTKKLAAGTTVSVEDPYVSVLSGATTWETKNCAKCYKNISLGIPCDDCVFVLYCSEDCRAEDFKGGHEFECPCLAYEHVARFSSNYQLGLKSICRAGPATLYGLYKGSKKPEGRRKSRRMLKGFDPKTGLYESNSYYQILRLAAHYDEESMNYWLLTSIAVTWILMFRTKFFDQVEMSERAGFIEFMAGTFYRHAMSIQFNTIGMTVGKKTCMIKNPQGDTPQVGVDADDIKVVSVYSFASNMNHACYPTVCLQHLRNGRVAVITNQMLKPGDGLLHGYHLDFMSCPLSDRQTYLLKFYRFPCDCVACVNKWPMTKDLDSVSKQICKDCSTKFRNDQIQKIQSCILRPETDDGILKCEHCGRKFVAKELNVERMHFTNILGRARQNISDNEPLRAIEILPECVEYFQNTFSLPSLQIFLAESLLQNAIQLAVRGE